MHHSNHEYDFYSDQQLMVQAFLIPVSFGVEEKQFAGGFYFEDQIFVNPRSRESIKEDVKVLSVVEFEVIELNP